jgi:type II secretory pathway pseudopilin PulG
MSETLLGVIIGGLIASVAPITMLILDYRRWQRQAMLEQLRLERTRLEKMFRVNLKKLSQAIAENSFPSDMIMDFILTMPKEVSIKFKEFLADPDKTDVKYKKAYISLVSSMKKVLSDIDSRIEDIIFKKSKFDLKNK